MNVTVNGEARRLPEGTATVRVLLGELRYSFPSSSSASTDV